MRLRPPLLLLAGVTAAAAVAAAPGVASATPAAAKAPTVTVLDNTVLAPFQLAHDRNSVYVADGGTGTVSKLTRHGLVPVAHAPDSGETAGVAINGKGTLAYTWTTRDAQGNATATGLTIKPKHGKARTVDLLTFEQTRNPDKWIRYGIDNPTECQKQAFEQMGGASYRGLVDSHPYAVAALPGDAWVVADAGGNDLLKVDRHGRITVLSVLPRQPTVITASAASALGLPDCVVGATYNFEAVPTDVEVAADGRFIVSLLPGGPEDPSLGARGSVVSVNPRNGNATKLATGLLGGTNVALGPDGKIFYSELFAGRIGVIEHGKARTYVELANPLGLTYFKGALYAGTLGPGGEEGPTGPGSIVRIR
jgi:hypothetical protein